MDAAPLEHRRDLEALFDDLAEELTAQGEGADIVMVGGSWLLWHAERASTWDVDSARRLGAPVRAAAARVAAHHDLPDHWLNDQAAMFWPANADLEDGVIVYRRAGLVVRTPPPETLFLMKLYRSHPQDYEDMRVIWPRCRFASPEAAAQAFRAAYPHAPEDEHLTAFIAEIAEDR